MDAKDWTGVLILLGTQLFAFVKMIHGHRTRISLLEQSLKNVGNGHNLAVLQSRLDEQTVEIKELRKARHDLTGHLARYELAIADLREDIKELRRGP